MNSFTEKELILSLLFPFLSFLWGAGSAVFLLFEEEIDLFSGIRFPNVTWIAAILIGGILPAVLTLSLKIHTEQYLKKRLFVIVPVIVVFQILTISGNGIMISIYMLILCPGAIVYQILKVQTEETSGGERAVLMLSDPCLYWMIYELLKLLCDFLI